VTNTIDGRTGQRPSLSRDVIAAAAMELAVRNPTIPITLARLGAELGADPTALYRHYRNRNELMLDVVDRCFGEVLAAMPDDPDWRVQLLGTSRALRAVLLRTPALAAELGLRFTGGPNETRLIGRVVDIMRSAGLTDDPLLEVRAIGGIVLSHAVMTASMLMQSPDDLDSDMGIAAQLAAQLADSADLPDLRAYEDEAFERAIHVYLVGLERTISAAARSGTLTR
jgi:AcrR family transcriptional regulator